MTATVNKAAAQSAATVVSLIVNVSGVSFAAAVAAALELPWIFLSTRIHVDPVSWHHSVAPATSVLADDDPTATAPQLPLPGTTASLHVAVKVAPAQPDDLATTAFVQVALVANVVDTTIVSFQLLTFSERPLLQWFVPLPLFTDLCCCCCFSYCGHHWRPPCSACIHCLVQ